MKILILSILLLASTLLSKGFDTPTQAFLKYIDIANYAVKDRGTGDNDKASINKLKSFVYSNRNSAQRAEILIGQHNGYKIHKLRYARPSYDKSVSFKYTEPRKARRDRISKTVSIRYTYFKFQEKKFNQAARNVKFKARKVGNKIKWFIY